MKTINISNIENINALNLDTLCLGFFDALHLGHLALIDKAKEIGGTYGVLTFSRSPKELLLNQKCNIVNTLEMKEEILEKMGVSYLIILDLTWHVLNLSKEDFITKILKKINVKNIVCGFDYSFGKMGLGKASDLMKEEDFKVHIIEEVKNSKGEKISSTLVHSLIKDGNIEEANIYLTRPYKIKGLIEHGLKNGRRINFRTANVKPTDLFEIPSNGVYATKIYVGDKVFNAMTNVGVHPTINQLKEASIEAFIFDFDQDIYLKDVELEFYKKTRPECKFDSLESLKNQLTHDEQEIREYFKEL